MSGIRRLCQWQACQVCQDYQDCQGCQGCQDCQDCQDCLSGCQDCQDTAGQEQLVSLSLKCHEPRSPRVRIGVPSTAGPTPGEPQSEWSRRPIAL